MLPGRLCLDLKIRHRNADIACYYGVRLISYVSKLFVRCRVKWVEKLGAIFSKHFSYSFRLELSRFLKRNALTQYLYAIHPVVYIDLGIFIPSHKMLIMFYIICDWISINQSVYYIEHYIFRSWLTIIRCIHIDTYIIINILRYIAEYVIKVDPFWSYI
jgi:hypothetical protein